MNGNPNHLPSINMQKEIKHLRERVTLLEADNALLREQLSRYEELLIS